MALRNRDRKRTAAGGRGRRLALGALLALLVVACGWDAARTWLAVSDGASSGSADEATLEQTYAADGEDGEGEATQLSSLDVPDYSGDEDAGYVEVNGNVPLFDDDDIVADAYESYLPLDPLGRATGAVACLSAELMPTEERESISEVHPTGWHSDTYDFIDGELLYNRSHLIAYQLTGENANERNLITGTRYLNATTMLSYENEVADYIDKTGNHVMYRVTPVYDGENLLASGVLMEAWSVEDDGAGVCFCVYAYNVQPGVSIDYATGDNSAE